LFFSIYAKAIFFLTKIHCMKTPLSDNNHRVDRNPKQDLDRLNSNNHLSKELINALETVSRLSNVMRDHCPVESCLHLIAGLIKSLAEDQLMHLREQHLFQRRRDSLKPELSSLDIEKLFTCTEIFRDRMFSLSRLSALTGIDNHKLSALFKKTGESFSSFVNRHRINYILQRLTTGDLETFTLEGISIRAGFSSRSAFFNAFVKTTGKAPSQYFKYLKSNAQVSNARDV